MDNETEELVLCIQLQDLEDSLSQSKGKQREDAMTDGQLAFILAKEDLQRTLQLLRDRRMGRSLSRACETDQGLITTLNLQEDAARQDHATAQSLSGQAARPLAIMPGSPRVDIDDASLQRFAAMNEDAGSSGLTSILSGIQSFGFVEDEEETNQASSSSVQRKGNLPAFVPLSSVTSAESAGRRADATSGGKTDFRKQLTSALPETNLQMHHRRLHKLRKLDSD